MDEMRDATGADGLMLQQWQPQREEKKKRKERKKIFFSSTFIVSSDATTDRTFHCVDHPTSTVARF